MEEMEGLVRRTNIERYHQMLASPRDDAQRLLILKLLAEEKGSDRGRNQSG
jgi:hypothetical protein